MSRVLVIGPGPAVIGEGGELDAAAAEAVRTLRDRGHEVILVTSNPATVASDPTLAHRTYLEPLDEPALRAIVLAEKPALVFPMFGGRKALALALALHDNGTLAAAGTKLAGITAEALAVALADAGIAAAKRAALGTDASWTSLEVVAAFDATGAFLPIVTIESLDRAGVHPGDAVGVTPPLHVDATLTAEMHDAARAAILSAGLHAGIATCELAVRRNDRTVHVLSVVPGATRSAALAAQATGYPLSAAAVDLALDRPLAELGVAAPASRGVVVRWPRFAFETFPDADAALGAHRKSLGESLGVGATLADALRSAARGADDGLGVARPVKRASTQPASKRVLVLGAGPSRIGLGPELAMCASEALIADSRARLRAGVHRLERRVNGDRRARRRPRPRRAGDTRARARNLRSRPGCWGDRAGRRRHGATPRGRPHRARCPRVRLAARGARSCCLLCRRCSPSR